jgi:CheY-like chemotaxis protein
MRQSAAVCCHDKRSLQTLGDTLDELDLELVKCPSGQHALELIMSGECSTLIVDFDLPGAQEVVRMAGLLPPGQKPGLLAVASRAWPGTGQAFQSGASRILYRPLDTEELKDALQADQKARKSNRRKFTRYEVKTLVHLELESGTLSGISIDIGQHGLAMQAAEPVPMTSDLAFHCVLPGTDITLHGQADVMWAGDRGRAGLFFSKLAPAARKHLKHWLSKRNAHSKSRDKDKSAVRDLMPSEDAHVSFATPE